MRSMELIQIRSFSEQDRILAKEMFNTLCLKGPHLPVEMKLLENRSQPTDLLVCIYWETADPRPSRSEFGEKLAAAFKYFGWISHNLWDPSEEKNP